MKFSFEISVLWSQWVIFKDLSHHHNITELNQSILNVNATAHIAVTELN